MAPQHQKSIFIKKIEAVLPPDTCLLS